MNKYIFNLSAALVGVVATALIAATAFAAVGNQSAQINANGDQIRPRSGHMMMFGFGGENREAMQQAIEDGDYNAWYEAVTAKPVITETINSNNFARFVEMHKLMQSGDIDGAKAISEELGLPQPAAKVFKGERRGGGFGCPFAEQSTDTTTEAN